MISTGGKQSCYRVKRAEIGKATYCAGYGACSHAYISQTRTLTKLQSSRCSGSNKCNRDIHCGM